ncbi:MAG: tetratricopeptide repeat protein [Candidatus Krumholzibacteriia bacterium]
MQNQDLTPQQERKLRFFEAGILFVLILCIAVFVGLKTGGDETVGQDATAMTVPATPTAELAAADPDAAGDAIGEPAPADALAATGAADAAAPAAENEPVVVTYATAEQAYFDRDYAAAFDLFDRYTGEHPQNAWGFYMLGLSAWKAGDPDAADLALARAVELAPQHVKSLVNHGRVLLDLGRVDEAEARLTLAIDLDPAYADARRVMGRVHHAQARLDEAVASYAEALGLEADDAWSLNNLGLILIEQERFAEALAPLAKAAALDGAPACAQNNLGIALERSGHYGAAAEAYARALELEPGHAKAEESRTRVLALAESPDTEPVDLAALAAAFTVDDLTTIEAAAATGMEPQSPSDMEVAAAAAPTGSTDDRALPQPQDVPVPQSQDDIPDDVRNR